MIRPRPALALAAVTLLGTSGSLLAITDAQAAPTQGSGYGNSGSSQSGSTYGSSGTGGSGSGYSKSGSGYTKSGYNKSGYKSGYNKSGYGYNKSGYGYSKSGYNKSGYGNYGYKNGSGNYSSKGYKSTGQRSSQNTTQTSGGQSMLTLTGEQNNNARTIIAVAKGAGLPQRAQVVAIATALQESNLQNLHYGDRDSQGLFQQRPSAGWGSTSEITDPATAAKLFFGVADNAETKGLTQVAGWQTMSVAEAAQSTQISAFPDAYAKWQKLAEQTVAANQDVAPIN